jgi:hypothetical protein
MITVNRIAVLFLILILTGTAWAGPFKANEVSADAKWVMHVDVEGIVSSQMGKLLLGLIEDEADTEELDEVGDMLGMDFRHDIYSASLYGTTYEEEVIVLLKGRFDKEKILALMDKECDYTQEEHGDHVVYAWKDGRDPFKCCFYKKKMIVVCNSADQMTVALDVLDGKTDSLADGGELDLNDLPRGALFAGAARGFAKLAGAHGPEAEVIKKAEKVLICAGEMEGNFFVDATLYTRDRETAQQIHDVFRGLLSLGAMLGTQEEELAQLNKILKNAKLDRDGRKIRFRHSQSIEELVELIQSATEL